MNIHRKVRVVLRLESSCQRRPYLNDTVGALRKRYEDHHRVKPRAAAIEAAVQLSVHILRLHQIKRSI